MPRLARRPSQQGQASAQAVWTHEAAAHGAGACRRLERGFGFVYGKKNAPPKQEPRYKTNTTSRRLNGRPTQLSQLQDGLASSQEGSLPVSRCIRWQSWVCAHGTSVSGASCTKMTTATGELVFPKLPWSSTTCATNSMARKGRSSATGVVSHFRLMTPTTTLTCCL